jgi:predicted HNH restriction endonuclease
MEFQYKQYIERWKNGLEDGIRGDYQLSAHIRRYLFEKYNNKCTRCGWGEINLWTGYIPLEVHHIDGDYTNNEESNLDLLCPNCHSLTDTYKNANTNGRSGRKKYYH